MNTGSTNFSVEKHGHWWTVRVRKPNGSHSRERVCPVNGDEALDKAARYLKAKQIVQDAKGGVTPPVVLTEEGIQKITFKEAAERYMTRRQNPRYAGVLKSNTVRLWIHYLVRWIYPVIGDLPLAQVKNVQAEKVVDRMYEAKCSTSVITDTFNLIRSVVASVLDDDKQPIFDVKWNWQEIKPPDVAKKEMKAFTSEQADAILSRSSGQYQAMFALLLASGIREGECMAFVIGGDKEKVTTLSSDCRILYVNTILLQSGEIQDSPKTPAGRREVDIHPDIAKRLLALIGDRTSGYLFCSKNGTPLSYGNIRKNVLDNILYDVERPIMKREGRGWKKIGVNKIPGVVGPPETEGYGFHSFRRFRTTYLRTEAAVNDAYVTYWIGHGKKTITDEYTKIKQNTAKRRELCEQAGLGFKLPVQKVVALDSKSKTKKVQAA